MTSQRNRPSTLQRVGYTLGAIVAGVVVGSLLNMGTIVLGSSLLPPPAGVDVNDVASINASIEQYSVAQLLVPFVAHALGTLVGAWVAALVARRVGTVKVAASVIALLFLAGGVGAMMMIPAAPLWFDVLDLGLAYLPMAWLGVRLASRTRAKAQ